MRSDRAIGFCIIAASYAAAVYVPRSIDLSFVTVALMLAWAASLRGRSPMTVTINSALLVAFVQLGVRESLQRHWFPS